MSSILHPDMYIDSILKIPLDDLRSQGIQAFILDLDNTITEWNSQQITQEIRQWFAAIKKYGFKVCILSNNGEKRVLQIAEILDIPYIFRAQKPRRQAFFRALKILETQPETTAVIGDQIFTDIWGGNRAGLYTILVVPLARKEFAGTKISRLLESLVIRKLIKYHTNPH